MTVVLLASTAPTIGEQFAALVNVAVVLTLVVYMVCGAALFRFARILPARSRLFARALVVATEVFCAAVILGSGLILILWAVGIFLLAAAVGFVYKMIDRSLGRGGASGQ